MAKDGLGYFYNKLGLSSNDLAFHYNFSNGVGNSVAVYSGDPSLNGAISNHSDFWDFAGSGAFNQGELSVNNYQTLKFNNWSTLSVVEKSTVGSEVIFSTMDALKTSGIVVSLDDSNNIIVSTKDSGGYIFSESYDLNLSNKNILGFSKAGNTISCFRYDPSQLSFEVSSKTFPSSCNINNFDQFDIGNSLSDLSNSFSGFIDDFVLMKTPLNSRQFEILSSGFVRDSFEITPIPKTGYSFGVAHCSEGEYISGFSGNVDFDYTQTPSLIDFDFISTLQKSAVKINNCNDIDSLYIAHLKTDPIINFNKELRFDSINGVFKSQLSQPSSDVIFYESGLLKQSPLDYSYTSRSFITSGGSTTEGSGVMDVCSHTIYSSAFNSGDLGSGDSIAASHGNSLLFINGKVAVSGIDYNESGGNFVINNNEHINKSGELQELFFTVGELDVYSTTDGYQELNFYDNSAMVFIDNLRVKKEEFKEMSDKQLDANIGTTPCFDGEAIYNNEGTYFNE